MTARLKLAGDVLSGLPRVAGKISPLARSSDEPPRSVDVADKLGMGVGLGTVAAGSSVRAMAHARAPLYEKAHRLRADLADARIAAAADITKGSLVSDAEHALKTMQRRSGANVGAGMSPRMRSLLGAGMVVGGLGTTLGFSANDDRKAEAFAAAGKTAMLRFKYAGKAEMRGAPPKIADRERAKLLAEVERPESGSGARIAEGALGLGSASLGTHLLGTGSNSRGTLMPRNAGRVSAGLTALGMGGAMGLHALLRDDNVIYA